MVPGLLRATLGMSSHNDWMVYLPVLVVSIAVMVPAIVIAEKYRRMKGVFVARGGGAGREPDHALRSAPAISYVLLAALVVFFSAFNVMEASLPSLITKTAPPDAKGTATGLYSSVQFLGIFAGGVRRRLGATSTAGSAGVFALTTALALAWLLAAATMAQPSYLTTRLVPIGDVAADDAERLAGAAAPGCRAWSRRW